MRHDCILPAVSGLVALLGLLLLTGGGCSTTNSKPKGGPRGKGSTMLTRSVSTVYPGKLDHANRYLPAVQVQTPGKIADAQSDCSGVLIGSRLVVTAGHCVCTKRSITSADRAKVAKVVGDVFSSQTPEERQAILAEIMRDASTIIDSSQCAGSSFVSLRSYSPAAQGENMDDDALRGHSTTAYPGDVRPHDDLVILYDKKQQALFKTVDLAAIVLRRPVQGVERFAKLAKAEVREEELVLMAGYGLRDEDRLVKLPGDRYFGESRIVRVVRSGSRDVQFYTGAAPAADNAMAHVYGGDSGGPCLRKSDDTILVGIASGYTIEDDGSKLSMFTSIFPHRKWLEKIAREVGVAVH